MSEKENYKASIAAWDPGKTGYCALLSADGTKYKFWPMPLIGGIITASAIASVYREIEALCKVKPLIVIERIFTRPTDACSQNAYDDARFYLTKLKNNLENGDPIDHAVPQLPEVRMDGRVGNLRYSHGAALLEMGALLGWPITTVSPKTWMSVLYKGMPGHLISKDRSRYYIQQKWPELHVKGSEIWPKNAKKPLDGACDALCLADYFRMKTYG